jgi:chromosome segregation ATPase
MKTGAIIAVITGLCTLLGTAFTVDARYAKIEDIQEILVHVDQVDNRLEIKIKKDRCNSLQERMWKLEDRYGSEVDKMPQAIREQYRELKKEYDELQMEIKELLKPKPQIKT